MILHLIEIILLLAISVKLGIDVDLTPKNNWDALGFAIIVVIIIIFEYWFYHADINYDKIRRIVQEELKKEDKR